jgi:HK97 family phage portal protein
LNILSKLKSTWFFGGASVQKDPRDFGYYQLTKFDGDRPVLDGKATRIPRGRGIYDLGMQLKDFFLGRLMTDQQFLRARMRHEMDDEAPLTNPYDQVAGVYACVRARSVPIAMVPLKVFEWKTDPKTGEQELVEVDNQLSLVLFSPNPVTSRYNLTEGSVANLSLNGEFMWFLDRDQPTDFPRAIWPLPVTHVKPIKDKITGLPVFWEYNPGPTKPNQIYDLHQIVHGKRWSSTSYIRGQGDQKAASMATGQDWDAQRYNRTFLKNACDPGGTFELPVGVTLAPEDERKVLKAWEERHQGPSKQGRPGILTGGMKWNNNAIPHRDMRWLKQREWNLQDIRMVHGVGKIHLGLTDGVSVATAEVTERLFWTNELIPEIRLIEDAIWQVTRFIEDGRYEVLFDLRGVAALQKGIEDKTQAAKDLFSIGAPAQEVNRALGLGLEPWDGWDISYLPISLLPAGTERPPPGEEGEEAARTALRAVGRQKALSPPLRRPTDPITKRAEARRRLLPDGVPGGPRIKIWPTPKNGKKKASMAEMARKLAAYLETARKSGVGVIGDGVCVPEAVHDILAEKDGMILCADPDYPFTPEEDRAYAEKFLQTVYKEDEEEFASKYSRWNQEHRVETLRNFKRETDWEGDPTKAVAFPPELKKAIADLKPKAFEPDGFDLLLNLHDGISDRVLSLDEKYLDRILKQTDVNIDDVLPDPIDWGEKLGDATRAAYESALLTGAAARAGDLGASPQITAINVNLASWIDEVCTDKIKFISPRLNLALKRSLVEGVLEGESLDQLATRIKRIHNKSGNRAPTIARTEVGKAGEHGAYRESTESGLVEGHWWVPGGANIRASHAAMRGQFAAIGTAFTTGKGSSLLHPHDPNGAASEVINCKCVLRPRLKD